MKEVRTAGPDVVVFILHGIRDSNAGWVTDIAEEIEKRSNVVVDPSTYGWFSAIKFALPWMRRANLPWFLDRYSYHFIRNPKTKFRFIGHSNGTYVLGMSLRLVPAMRFDRVYLAGSVLPKDYEWHEIFPTRVEWVANQCSSDDVPVGCLCRLLNALTKRVGTGGFDGFVQLPDKVQTRWFHGGHGAPLRRNNQPAIVNYILNETLPDEPPLPPWPSDAVGKKGTTLSFRIARLLLARPVGVAFLLLLGGLAFLG